MSWLSFVFNFDFSLVLNLYELVFRVLLGAR